MKQKKNYIIFIRTPFLGSGPGRERSSVEWEKIGLFVLTPSLGGPESPRGGGAGEPSE